MAQENQRFKFKVKFYGGNQTNHECSKSESREGKMEMLIFPRGLSQKSQEIKPTTLEGRRLG